MRQQPFGQTFKFSVSLSRSWVSVGAGWAAIAGALATGLPDLSGSRLLQLIGLWILVDPVLGTLWALAVRHGLWRQVIQARLPRQPARRGFSIPYAQPDSAGGQLVLLVRRYQLWWQQDYWPAHGSQVVTFGLGLLLALLLGLVLRPILFWLVALSVGLTIIAGQQPSALASGRGGRLASVVHLLLPWLMGAALWSNPSLFGLGLGICFWSVYLGGLRILDGHRRAEWLFFGGQLAAILLLVGLRLLPGAAIVSLCLLVTQLLNQHFEQPAEWLKKAQPYLIIAMITAGVSIGLL